MPWASKFLLRLLKIALKLLIFWYEYIENLIIFWPLGSVLWKDFLCGLFLLWNNEDPVPLLVYISPGLILFIMKHTVKLILEVSGLILGLRPANERRRYFVMTSHWLGASLESALGIIACMWFIRVSEKLSAGLYNNLTITEIKWWPPPKKKKKNYHNPYFRSNKT